MTQGHLLIIDDDKKLRQLLNQYLSRYGFIVSEAENPKQAEEILKILSFDAIIMDVMMPFQNGIEYTQVLRQKGISTPILILTAIGDTPNKISGLEAGADDYLSKPFDPKELLLRLKNLLKHSPGKSNGQTFGPFSFKNDRLMKENKIIDLTPAEKILLKALIEKINTSISREELAERIQSKSLRTVDVQMLRLRKKIENDSKHPFWLQTIRGKGYKLVNS